MNRIFLGGIFVGLIFAALANLDTSTKLEDGSGKTVGYVKGTFAAGEGKVYDASNVYVGRFDQNGVYDKSNKKIARSPELIGWLIERK